MNSNKDYYKILNIPEDIEQADIKKAYKKLAIKWHPDKNKSSNAEEKFKEISEAYQILSDPDKRKEYDNPRNYGTFNHVNFINPFDLFDSFFNDMHRSDDFSRMEQHFRQMQQDMRNMNRGCSSESHSYSNVNGNVTKKTVKNTTKNGKTYKEIIEESNGEKKITKIYPDGTKKITNEINFEEDK